MKTRAPIFIFLASLALTGDLLASKSPLWNSIAEADLKLMGDYEGKWIDPPKGSYQIINPTVAAQVYNIDIGRYGIHFVQDLNRRADKYYEGVGKLAGDEIIVRDQGWAFTVSKAGIEGTALVKNELIRFSLQRKERLSPTLGAKPPAGAIVLFDGSNFDEWEHLDGREVTWNLIGDGAMEIEPKKDHQGVKPAIGGDIRTKRRFKDVIYHMEFRYPVEPGKSGQGRGNSGLFFQGYNTEDFMFRGYEVQILNSYALGGLWNECGALYKYAPPKVNAARPPLQWQTYDVEYRAPRYKNGKLVEHARISVDLNGTKIHRNEVIVHGTEHKENDRWEAAPSEPGPIRLQDHTNRIQFRNIWVKEVDLD